jgi:chromosome segregation ATPase
LQTDEVQVNNDVLTAYKLLTDTLIKQLAEKDNQMNEKDTQIASLIKLSENFQVLQKDKPQENILQLEAHFEELDTKLEEVKTKMSDRKEQQEHKSFFSKMFKSSD